MIAPNTAATVGEGASRAPWRTRLLIVLLTALLLAWPSVLLSQSKLDRAPAGRSNGADFAMFLGAARVLQLGGNPYNHDLLYRVESRLLQRQGVPMTPRRQIVRVGNPPLFFWILQPLIRVPFRAAAVGWMAGMLLLSILGFLAALHALGWRHKALPCLLFACIPQTMAGVLHANNVAVLFAAISVSLLLVVRFPIAAGALLGVGWIKPQLGLPVVLLLTLMTAGKRSHLVAGFIVATLGFGALTCLATGPHSLLDWMVGMRGYGHDIADQTAIPSLAGAYVTRVSPPLRLVLSTAGLIGAGALTVRQWWRCRLERRREPWVWAPLWFVWFLAMPYTHITDEILLAIPMLALLRPDARHQIEWLPAMALLCVLFSPLPRPWSQAALVAPLPLLLLADGGPRVALSWRGLAPYSLLSLSSLCQTALFHANGQFLALSAATLCVWLATGDRVLCSRSLPQSDPLGSYAPSDAPRPKSGTGIIAG